MALSRLPPVPVQETDFSAVQNDTDPTVSAGTMEPGAASRKAPRALGPDLLRGLIIVLQALDHAALSVNAWPHGVAIESEADGQIVNRWNSTTARVARMLTHLCAPGFLFLLGMGIVYFSKSRKKLGWSSWRMVKHFFIRCAVLILVSQFLSFTLTGRLFFILNIVLYALAINYFLTGVFWLVLDLFETFLSSTLGALFSTEKQRDETQPLLLERTNNEELLDERAKAKLVAFQVINFLVLALSLVAIWWNIWLSPDNGHCKSAIRSQPGPENAPRTIAPAPTVFSFLFYIVQASWIQSVFPPLAWLSFALLGVLYARLLLHYKPGAAQAAAVTAMSGIMFAIIFVLTRIFHFGNLTEDCLKMPEIPTTSTSNQYLTSVQAFFYAAKYPPDVAFLCYSMAVNMWLLSIFSLLPPLSSKENNDVSQTKVTPLLRGLYGILLPFGQCALFFYAAHILFYMMLSPLIKFYFGHKLDWYDMMKRERAIGVGNSPIFWIFYFSGLSTLWFACRYYAKFKAGKGPDSLWRFF